MQQLARVCGHYLTEKGNQDLTIWVLDGDLADSDGADTFALKNQNFIQAGIAEQNMISMAAGLAAVGCRPWVFSFAAFLCYRGYDQIRTCISHTALPVTLVGSHAGACTGRNGKSHASLNDVGLMVTLPNMVVWTPGDAQDVRYAIDSISSQEAPAYIRCPRDPQLDLPGSSDKIRWIGNPSQIAIFSYGLSTQWALKIQQHLMERGFEIGILHFCKLWPLPKNFNDLTEDVKQAFVIEDHYPIGGLASCLFASKVNFEIISITWPLDYTSQSGTAEDLTKYCGLSCDKISEKIVETIERKKYDDFI